MDNNKDSIVSVVNPILNEDLGSSIISFVERSLKACEIAIQAVVVEYNEEEGTAVVQPLVKYPYMINDGTTKYEDRPQINVHVLRMSIGGFAVYAPISKGQVGWVVSGDRNGEEVFAKNTVFTHDENKENTSTREPVDFSSHLYEHGFFIPTTWGEIKVPDKNKKDIAFVDSTQRVVLSVSQEGVVTYKCAEMIVRPKLTIVSNNEDGDTAPDAVIDPDADLQYGDHAKFREIMCVVSRKDSDDGTATFSCKKMRVLCTEATEKKDFSFNTVTIKDIDTREPSTESGWIVTPVVVTMTDDTTKEFNIYAKDGTAGKDGLDASISVSTEPIQGTTEHPGGGTKITIQPLKGGAVDGAPSIVDVFNGSGGGGGDANETLTLNGNPTNAAGTAVATTTYNGNIAQVIHLDGLVTKGTNQTITSYKIIKNQVLDVEDDASAIGSLRLASNHLFIQDENNSSPYITLFKAKTTNRYFNNNDRIVIISVNNNKYDNQYVLDLFGAGGVLLKCDANKAWLSNSPTVLPANLSDASESSWGTRNLIATLGWVKDNFTFTQVNADWNETDATKKSFIENKPTIPVVPSSLPNPQYLTISNHSNSTGTARPSSIIQYNGNAAVSLNMSGYVIQSQLGDYITLTQLGNRLENYVTINTTQTISGAKIFNNRVRVDRHNTGSADSLAGRTDIFGNYIYIKSRDSGASPQIALYDSVGSSSDVWPAEEMGGRILLEVNTSTKRMVFEGNNGILLKCNGANGILLQCNGQNKAWLSNSPNISPSSLEGESRTLIATLGWVKDNFTQVNADWNAQSGSKAYIANKPTIPPAIDISALNNLTIITGISYDTSSGKIIATRKKITVSNNTIQVGNESSQEIDTVAHSEVISNN